MSEIFIPKERREFLRQQYGNDRKQFPDLFEALDDLDTLEDLLVSARAIAERRGVDTAWERFSERLVKAGIGSVTAKVFKVLPSDLEPTP